MKNVALIMAAGKSSRCGFDKLVEQLGHQTVLQRCLQTFSECEAIDELWVVGRTEVDLGFKVDLENTKIKGFITGGSSRFESVKNGLNHCLSYYEYPKTIRIIVHNAANPYLSKIDLEQGLKQAEAKPNLIFGFFSPNSIKQIDARGQVEKILNREKIFETQTPQISLLSSFQKALEVFETPVSFSVRTEFELSSNSKIKPKDEAELLALINEPIHVYECAPSNTKITYASDFHIAAHQKLGIGEDSHRFASAFNAQKPFRLGGIDMSDNRLSSDGNSDGDVILHALCNALLSAFGEITFDTIAAPIYAEGQTNSTAYLAATLSYLNNAGHAFKIDQLLISLEGSQPRIAPHHDEITNSLARLLSIEPTRIGLTYTTGEGLSAYGKGLGMHAWVLVSLNHA